MRGHGPIDGQDAAGEGGVHRLQPGLERCGTLGLPGLELVDALADLAQDQDAEIEVAGFDVGVLCRDVTVAAVTFAQL